MAPPAFWRVAVLPLCCEPNPHLQDGSGKGRQARSDFLSFLFASIREVAVEEEVSWDRLSGRHEFIMLGPSHFVEASAADAVRNGRLPRFTPAGTLRR